jgi:hypothetical protein
VTALVATSVSVLSAQEFDLRPMPLAQRGLLDEGGVQGLVRDDAGQALPNVAVLAVGPSALPFIARSGASGEFALRLPSGEYVLRAVHADYVSTYREPVRIQSPALLQRNIVLRRKPRADEGPLLFAAAAGLPVLSPVEAPQAEAHRAGDAGSPPLSDDHAHDETAWRLRHLKPTALRDVTASSGLDTEAARPDFNVTGSFVDAIMLESARAAASYFTGTDFTGQVNFLTTGSIAPAGSGMPADVPHGIAYLAVGAPVGSAGDWTVRGGMSARTLASWVVLAEYQARADQAHAFRAGVSYSAQPMGAPTQLTPVGLSDRVRSVGGMYAEDQWQAHSRLQVSYGLRVDRYDYVNDAEFISPRAGVRMQVLPATHVTLTASQYVVAPGANEFLPPGSPAPWVPPERTFSPLGGTGVFRAERVREIQIGVEQALAASEDPPVLAVQRFRESTHDQVATLFGLDAESGIGHYYVATPGSVIVDGWVARLSGGLLPRVSGSVAYTTSTSDWAMDAAGGEVARLVPSVLRLQERLHDLTTSVIATLPETSTRIRFAYRLNTGFAVPAVLQPAAAGRFNFEVRQGLPWRVTSDSRTELVMVFRNLFRDLGQPGSRYDELLTLAPPMRIIGGVQVRF